MDDDTKEVTLDGKGVRFTPIEYNILLFLLKIRGKYFLLSRSIVIYGMRKPSVLTTRWQYISAISGRRSN